jgi:hypothetical protein
MKLLAALLSCVALVSAATCASAETHAPFNPHADPVPAALAAGRGTSLLADGVSELKFGEIFKLPVGPKGLETSARLRSLDGQRVRMVGFMVARETAAPGQFIIASLPVLLGDEDESFSDDLPANAVFVHLHPSLASQTVSNLHGPMQLVGTLRVGAHEEADGRVSTVRLELDAATSSLLFPISQNTAAR